MFSPDGKTIASSGADETVRLWDANTGKERKERNKYSGPFSRDICMVFSPDSKTIVTAGPNQSIYLRDVETGKIGYTLTGYKEYGETPISSVAFSPDGKLMATGTREGTVTILESNKAEDGSTTHLYTFEGHRTKVVDIAFVMDGTVVASRSMDGVIYLWNITAPSKPLPQR